MENLRFTTYGSDNLLVKISRKTLGRITVLDRDQPGAYISHLHIEEAYRNKGIGSQVMQLAIEWVKREGCTAVSLHVSVANNLAIRFYQRHGFFICATTTDKDDAHYLMAKHLI